MWQTVAVHWRGKKIKKTQHKIYLMIFLCMPALPQVPVVVQLRVQAGGGEGGTQAHGHHGQRQHCCFLLEKTTGDQVRTPFFQRSLIIIDSISKKKNRLLTKDVNITEMPVMQTDPVNEPVHSNDSGKNGIRIKAAIHIPDGTVIQRLVNKRNETMGISCSMCANRKGRWLQLKDCFPASRAADIQPDPDNTPSLLLFCSQVTGSAAQSQEPGLDIETATRKNRKENQNFNRLLPKGGLFNLSYCC